MAEVSIQALFDRNVDWAIAKTRQEPGYFRRLSALQEPRFLWIGCSDSRVPANEIVGLDPGELFVHRNIANVMHTGDLNLLSVIEFAVEALRVEDIIICGHYGCGGVRRALERQAGALVDHWLAPVVDVYERQRERFDPSASEEARLNLLCELNVEAQVSRVARTPIVRAAWAGNRPLRIHGWIYGLKDGLVRDLGVTRSGPEEAEIGPVMVDPTPIDDWSGHIHASAIRLLGGHSGRGCACPAEAGEGEPHEAAE
ncbi:Carbonic anhydrase [Hyphomicrobiales bacterium]|nr:Carbonic anhydrase [Hyphomicrobiales bacterium]CAH1701448.1 Carbonic anhydrase [Hyphomicrobiales bacterium]CAI0345406.1 carbonic anhydrase [Hyphomicrobiales bacterium]